MFNLCCRKSRENSFILTDASADAPVQAVPSDTLWLDFTGYLPEKLSKNAIVYPGMLLARHRDEGKGDLHCPVVGVVGDASAQGIMIKVGTPAPKPVKNEQGEEVGVEEPEIPVTQAVDIAALSGEALLGALRQLGVDTGWLRCPCETLVINALNPEPGIAWARSMLMTQTEILQAGFAVLRRIASPSSMILAVGQPVDVSFTGVEIREVPARYPSSLAPLVLKAVTGQENPDNACCVGIREIWKLGRVAQSGLPLTETILTVNGINIIAPIGTPARALLEQAGMAVGDGDWLVFGGPMRGEAQARPQAGVGPGTYGITVVSKDAVPPLDGAAPCIACGECVQVCPARIQPDLLSRFSEFGMDEKCRDFHIAACMDCGLCTWVCPSRRPVLQYLELARQRLAAGFAEGPAEELAAEQAAAAAQTAG